MLGGGAANPPRYAVTRLMERARSVTLNHSAKGLAGAAGYGQLAAIVSDPEPRRDRVIASTW